MPTRPTAPVNGARLTARALPMGVAHGLPRSDHSAGQRDSPEALGSLLALTGLMLEKESELSSAVVGRAAGQQDQGEQSPMAASEMERRIGLMERLNDAEARLRLLSEPEFADNDADIGDAIQSPDPEGLSEPRETAPESLTMVAAANGHGSVIDDGDVVSMTVTTSPRRSTFLQQA